MKIIILLKEQILNQIKKIKKKIMKKMKIVKFSKFQIIYFK